jgi:cell wall-associated NlpC family hydrolase
VASPGGRKEFDVSIPRPWIRIAVITVVASSATSLAATNAAAGTPLRLDPVMVAGRQASTGLSALLAIPAPTTDFVVPTVGSLPVSADSAPVVVADGARVAVSVTARAAFNAARIAYVSSVNDLADLVAARTGVSATALVDVWNRTDSVRLTAVYAALGQVGTRYVRKGAHPGGFDCSGLTSYAWAQAGVVIPRSSGEQIRWAQKRTAATLLPGDLVWRPGHVMLYLGTGDAVVEATEPGRPILVDSYGKARKFGSPLPAPPADVEPSANRPALPGLDIAP